MKPFDDGEHIRFVQQAGWTHDLRQYLYRRVEIGRAERVLDVGCGTGVLLEELQKRGLQVFGIDIDPAKTKLARYASSNLVCADGRLLPCPKNTFDVTLCHFVLLWVNNPVALLSEMARVTRPSGWVLALAEPDYGGRIDYPDALSLLGEWQSEALRHQGADPQMGRKLAEVFQQAGLQDIETGVLGGQWGLQEASAAKPEAWELEWKVLQNDLKRLPGAPGPDRLAKLYEIESQSRQRGERVLFVPTFWAMGKAPKD